MSTPKMSKLSIIEEVGGYPAKLGAAANKLLGNKETQNEVEDDFVK